MRQHIIQWITPAVEHLYMAGYWIALLAAMLETVPGVGLLLPGSTLILFLGALSAQGYLDLGDFMWISPIGILAGVALALTFIFYFVRRAFLKHGRQLLAMAGSIAYSIKEGVASNRKVAQLIQRHPRPFRFMARRLDRNVFKGLPLTLLCISFIYILILFGGIVEDFLTGDPIVAVDVRIANLLIVFRTPPLSAFSPGSPCWASGR